MNWNPIVVLYITLGIILSLITSNSLLALGFYSLGFIIVMMMKPRGKKKRIINRMIPFFYFIPIMGFLYFILSIWLTDSSLNHILYNTVFSIVKLMVMVGIMSVYLEYSKLKMTVDAIRSVWIKTRLSWKSIDNIFLYFELVLRFFPMIRSDWTAMLNSRKTFRLSKKNQKTNYPKLFVKYLPGIIIQCYRKSEEVAEVMIKRGYGKQIPRGILYPIPVTWKDGILFTGVTIMLVGVNYFAKI